MIEVDDIPPLVRPEGLAVAEKEYERYLDQLRLLSDRDWPRETACPPWTVQEMAAHVLGQAEFIASIREAVHQRWASARQPGHRQDEVNEVQIGRASCRERV